jgi:hypothetical protein
MKKDKLLIMGSLLCLMCGSCRLPYLNKENKDYEELKELSRSTDFTLTIGECGESLIMSGHFTLEISIRCSPEKTTQFNLHSLSFQNSQGDTLSYSLDYLAIPKNNASSVSLQKDYVAATIMADTATKGWTNFILYAKCDRHWFSPSKVYVTYDIEVNGERFIGECWFKRKLIIENRIFPGPDPIIPF